MSARMRDAAVVTLCTLAVSAAWAFLVRGQASTGQWPGVDEAVIGRFVDESGSHSVPSFAWIRGDLLLFAFLLAGLLAGFVLGFFARSALAHEGGAE